MQTLKVIGLVLWSLITWPTQIAVGAVLWALGLILVPACLAFGAYESRESKFWPGRKIVAWTPKWMFLWGNEEDGIDGRRAAESAICDPAQQWWQDECYQAHETWGESVFIWSCIRNPTGNMRFVWPFGTKFGELHRSLGGYVVYDPSVQSVGNCDQPDDVYARYPQGTYWFFAWRGLFTGFWLIYRGWQFRIGWKFIPEDHFDIAIDDYRRKGVGFALQLQKK